MYTYMYRLLELFVIRCHTLAMPELQQNDFFAVEYLKNPLLGIKKALLSSSGNRAKTWAV